MSRISRRRFLAGVAGGAAGLALPRRPCAAESAAAAVKRPNIVIIMTDDSGFSDIGCYGSEIRTPNIDHLAHAGLRFAKFYNNARCSPTRASLLTGQYPHAVGAGDLCRPVDETPYPGYLGYMSDQCVTLAEVLREAGYHTMMSGKWHLGGERKTDQGEPARGELEKWPLGRGFERFFGLIHGATDYFRPWDRRPFRLGNDVYPVGENDDFYATDAITDYAIRWMEEARAHDSNPFFLYVPYTAPHGPVMAPKDAVAKYAGTYQRDWLVLHEERCRRLVDSGIVNKQWQPQPTVTTAMGRKAASHMATIAAMTEIVDRGVGRIVAKLRELGELDNTLLMYLSDNGAAGPHIGLANAPFVGRKGSLQEGGTAAHCIVHWPEVVKRGGEVTQQVGHVIDLMPTCVEMADAAYPTTYKGRSIPPMEGKSLLPVFRGEQREGHQHLFWDLYAQQAVVQGKWKYYNDRDGKSHLYDLEADGTEMLDLAERYPQKVEELRKAHAAWASSHNVLPDDVVKAAQRKNRTAKRGGARNKQQ